MKRFWLKDEKIYLNLAFGRSFYLCVPCFSKDDKKSLARVFKIKKATIKLADLKENSIYG